MNKVVMVVASVVWIVALGAIVFFVLWSLYSQWRRFQMHLSTTIILMFVAGGLIWANTIENGPQGDYVTFAKSGKKDEYTARRVYYGWPFHATTLYKPVFDEKAAGGSFTNPLVVFNLGIAFGILYIVWYLCERWIWRASRKEGRSGVSG